MCNAVFFDRVTGRVLERVPCPDRAEAVAVVKRVLGGWAETGDRIVWGYRAETPRGVCWPDTAAIQCPDGDYIDYEAAILFA